MLKVDDVYQLQGTNQSLQAIIQVTGIHEWIITMGMDRAQPGSKTANRTFLSTIAKGRIPWEADKRLEWIYFLLRLKWIESSEIKEIQTEIETVTDEFGIIDNITLESYLAADVESWCLDRDYECESVFPNYKNQYVAFIALWQLMNNGLFKAPSIPYFRQKTGQLAHYSFEGAMDAFREELEVFDHDETEQEFGSPYKRSKKKDKASEDIKFDAAERILDDMVYSVGWGVYASRDLWQGTIRTTGFGNFGELVPRSKNWDNR